MDARLNFFTNPVVRKVTPHLVAAAKALHDSTLPAETQDLVRIRASQINGCGSASTCTPRTLPRRARRRRG